MIKIFKNKATRRRNLILLIVPFVLVMLLCGYLAYRNVIKLTGSISGENTDDKSVIESMGYHLRSDATELQTQLFEELKESIEDGTDNFRTAGLIAENFVADFYTWTNKDGTYDIGGMYYIFNDLKINTYNRARDGFYCYLTYYINTYGKENLLEVESVTVDVSDKIGEYECEDKVYDSYFVTCYWTYKTDTKLNLNDFETKEYFTVIYNDNYERFEIVQAYGDN